MKEAVSASENQERRRKKLKNGHSVGTQNPGLLL